MHPLIICNNWSSSVCYQYLALIVCSLSAHHEDYFSDCKKLTPVVILYFKTIQIQSQHKELQNAKENVVSRKQSRVMDLGIVKC